MTWLVGAFALVGLSIVLLASGLWGRVVEPEQELPHAGQGASAPSIYGAALTASNPSASDLPVSSSQISKLPVLTRAENPYALVVALREKREPGSFAKARELVELCAQAISASNRLRIYQSLNLSADGLSPAASNAEGESNRVSAQQIAEARCRDISSNPELSTPLPDDRYGIEFQNAIKSLDSADPKMRKKALETIAEQGQLSAAYRQIAGFDGRPSYFMGKLLQGESLNEFQAAASISYMLDAEQKSGTPPDLRYLLSCSSKPSCPDNPADTVLSGLTDETKKRVLVQAQAIHAAIAARNVQAFVPR